MPQRHALAIALLDHRLPLSLLLYSRENGLLTWTSGTNANTTRIVKEDSRVPKPHFDALPPMPTDLATQLKENNEKGQEPSGLVVRIITRIH